MFRSRPMAIALALCLVTGPAHAQATGGAVTLDWSTNGTTPFEIAEEIATLYVSLFNTGNLAVQTVTLGDAGTVEAAMRRAEVFSGDHFPLALDAMLCDLNDAVCDRPRRPVADADLADAGAHVGGYAHSYGVWRVASSDEIVIPRYAFETRTTLARVPVASGWTPEAYTQEADVDCADWEMTCAEVVARFNPRVLGRKKDIESAALPVPEFSTRVPLAVDAGSRLAPALGAGIALTLPAAPPGPGTQAWRAVIDTVSPSNLALDRLNANIAPVGRVYSQASDIAVASAEPGSAPVPPEAAMPSTQGLLRAIDHPFATLARLPADLRDPVGVAIIDYRIDVGHCGWPDVFIAEDTTLPVATDPDCDRIDESAVADGDHGVHVAGLIAAGTGAFGPVGLNPSARLYLLPFDRTLDARQQIGALTQSVFAIPEDVRVVNMSIGFDRPDTGSDDRFRQQIGILEDHSLFVVAAGNDALDLRRNCDLLPACYVDMDNVMTVVGIDGALEAPGIWHSRTQGSNWSARFAIGAVAEDVLSTVSGNRYAHHSGTSSAAPQVAAAASLVFAAAERHFARELAGGRIAPKMVKDRLIYTADIFPELSGRMASGRLNVTRAVDVASDRFVLRDGTEVTGHVLEAPEWFKCRTPEASEAIQNWWNLRRLTIQEDGRYLIFKHDAADNGDRFAPLRQFPSCALRTITPVLRVRTPDGRTVEFTFGEILDYTSRMVDFLPSIESDGT